MIACGLDFGTSISPIGVLRGNGPALAPVEGARTLIPSAVFFEDPDGYRVQFGDEAISSYIAQADGRLLRALKSVLGSSLIDETTALGGARYRSSISCRSSSAISSSRPRPSWASR